MFRLHQHKQSTTSLRTTYNIEKANTTPAIKAKYHQIEDGYLLV